MQQVAIDTPFIKLGQLLKLAQVTSMGSESKFFILEGNVLVNGEVCLMRGKKIYKGDCVSPKGFEDIVVE